VGGPTGDRSDCESASDRTVITDRIAQRFDDYNAHHPGAKLVEVERLTVIRAACGHPVLRMVCSTAAADLLVLTLPLWHRDLEELRELATNDAFIDGIARRVGVGPAANAKQWTRALAADCTTWLTSPPSLQ
jgi:hypothetical protein